MLEAWNSGAHDRSTRRWWTSYLSIPWESTRARYFYRNSKSYNVGKSFASQRVSSIMLQRRSPLAKRCRIIWENTENTYALASAGIAISLKLRKTQTYDYPLAELDWPGRT